MNPSAVGLIAVAVSVIVAIIGSTWHLATKIGEVRVDVTKQVAIVHEVATRNDTKIETMWSSWIATRRPAETAMAQRAGR